MTMSVFRVLSRGVLGLAAAGVLCAPAPALAQTTVDQMTCAQAQRSAAQAGRYYKRTGFGVVPIFPVFPPTNRRMCESGEYKAPQMERTRDGRCIIAYKCQQREEIWDW